MASATLKTPVCAKCSKPTGIFKCHGCAQDFCTQHVTEHRQNLGQQMDEITSDHDQVKQSIAEYTIKSRCHPLMKEIDQWEQKSIKTIQAAAQNARKQVLNLLGNTTAKVMEMLEPLTKELSTARDDDTFVETDLKVWTIQLEKLKKDLNASQTILVKEDTHGGVPLIRPISIIAVPNDLFGQPIGNIEIEDNGQVIQQGFLHPAGAVRTMGEYSLGCHQFRFKIEPSSERKWIFFGIVSKAAPMQTGSYTALTAYGWAGCNEVFCNGVKSIGFKGYKTDMEKNDTFRLLVNCDRRKIRLTNERTHSEHQLDIDVNKCSFPWQLNLCLYYAGDKVRILAP